MGLFQDKLHKIAPVLKRHYIRKNGEICQQVSILGHPENYYIAPYLKTVKEFCECDEDILDKRIFLITENENVGLKAAFGLLYYPIYSNWDEMYANIEETLRIQLVTTKDYASLANNSEQEILYFMGLDENKLYEIMACQSRIQFVQLSKTQVNTSWARELMMDRECEIIQLPKITNEYYVKVLESLLTDERYRLDENLIPERLIRNSMKNCSNRFGEEDIAWSLDQAVKCAKLRGEYRILNAADFSLEQDKEKKISRIGFAIA